MILAAECTLFGRITDFYHEIDQVLYREHIVVQNWILRVDSFHKRPKFIDQLNLVRVHPEIRSEHQVEEKFLAQPRIIDQESEFGEQLDCLAVDWNDTRVGDR